MCIKGKKKNKKLRKNKFTTTVFICLPKEGKNKTNNIKNLAGQDLFISDKEKDN
jgi:hypothetical protein